MPSQVKELAKARGVKDDFEVLQGLRRGKGAEDHLAELCNLSARIKRDILGVEREDEAGLRNGLTELERLIEQAPPGERELLQLSFNINKIYGNYDWMDRAESYALSLKCASRKVRDDADVAILQMLGRTEAAAEREPAPIDTRETTTPSVHGTGTGLSAANFFSEDYVRNSPRFMESWRKARDIDVCGFAHNRMAVAFSGEMSAVLESGGRIRVLMQDPEGRAAIDANERSSTPKASHDEVRHQHRGGIATLQAIRHAAKAPKESMQLRTYDIMPPFTGYFFDVGQSSAHAYIWFWSWRQPSSWRPGFYVSAAEDELWHGRFSDQFDAMWTDSATKIIDEGQ